MPVSSKEKAKKTIDKLKEKALILNERLLEAEERYKAAELTLQKIKSTTSAEIQTAYQNGYNKAIMDMQNASGGFTQTKDESNVKKLVINNN